jgi:hypothetical protein
MKLIAVSMPPSGFGIPGTPPPRIRLVNGILDLEGLNLGADEPGLYDMPSLWLRAAGGHGAPERVAQRR